MERRSLARPPIPRKGEGYNAREVYAAHISIPIQQRKRPRPEEYCIISFTEDDLAHVTTPHNDALVITAEVDGCDMKMSLIDGGSLIVILFQDAFEKMVKSKHDLKRVDFRLIRFAGRTTYQLGAITLPVILGE